ncbi:hypothetical protein [Catenulispora subtropica]|uniref:Uncharacterized protein n=1 Tax=Catenulispora subtropica TaxID=450798 RepID=A0ABP5BYB3_9ACTN
MTGLTILVAVVAMVLVIGRERRIYKANKAFRAAAVQVVSPPGPRWWQVALSNLIYAALIGALLLALVRLVPANDTTPGPSTPLDGTTDGSGPSTGTAHSSASSNSSTPKGGFPMTDAFAIQRVRDGYLADIARRNTLIQEHQQSAAALEADNVIDARHAEVAAALIDQINADAAAVWAPVTEVDAAVLATSHTLTAGLPRSGKSAALPLLLAALYSAVSDVTGMDAKDVEYMVHDHFGGGDCPACLLTGAGDLAALDGIDGA